MIPANRTYLLQLQDKRRSYTGSLHILEARRQALIMELFRMTKPFLHSRDWIKKEYGLALSELRQARRLEGRETLAGLTVISSGRIGVEIIRQRILGVSYKDIRVHGDILRSPADRGYDYSRTTIHLDQAIGLFERLVAAMVDLAVFENKLKRLSAEIIAISRKIKILDEKILPRIERQIHVITQQIGEREREEYFRLKRFKKVSSANQPDPSPPPLPLPPPSGGRCSP